MKCIAPVVLAAVLFACNQTPVPFEAARICPSVFVFQIRLQASVDFTCEDTESAALDLVQTMERAHVALMSSEAWGDAIIWVHSASFSIPPYESAVEMTGSFDPYNGWVLTDSSLHSLAHEALHFFEARALGVTENGSRQHRSWADVPGFALADAAWRASHP
jgi:hypothetical protein